MAEPERSVLIQGPDGPVRILEKNIYFTFETGRLAYDCRTCGAQCCRGHAYQVGSSNELAAQLSTEPMLGMFIQAPSRSDPRRVLTVRNLKPACFMLTADGQCSIHLKHGFTAKPETCRLFPFNQFSLVGDFLVVAPHPSLCPLEVSHELRSESDHALLLTTMSESGIFQRVPRLDSSLPRARDAVALERRILSLAPKHFADADSEGFAVAQMLATSGACETSGSAGDIGWKVAAWKSALRLMVGVESGRSFADANVSRLMIAMTPVLRARLAFHPPGQAVYVPIDRVPFAILALEHFAVLAVTAGMQSVSYQTIMGLYRHYETVIKLAALADVRVRWVPQSRRDFAPTSIDTTESYGTFLTVARRLASDPPRLADAIDEAFGNETLGRLDRLDQLARRLLGRIVPERSSVRATATCRVGCWVLRSAPRELLMSAASRRVMRTRRSGLDSPELRSASRSR